MVPLDGTWYTRYIPRVDFTVTNWRNLAELSSEVVGQPNAYHRGSLRPEVNKLFVTFFTPIHFLRALLTQPLHVVRRCSAHSNCLVVKIHSLNPTRYGPTHATVSADTIIVDNTR